ncbi:MAG: hypothetical protein F6K44_13095 [Moorea sp. SIO3E2]|nr:hypothetical protein [Moorena sp. SIO3E2]
MIWCEAPAKLADLPYLPDVSIQLSAISYQLSAISYQLSAISLWVTASKPVPRCLDAKREWGKPRQLLMGGTPKTALPPQDRAASLLDVLLNKIS